MNYTYSEFHKVDPQSASLRNLFNQQHAQQVVTEICQHDLSQFTLALKNCGVRVMKEMFETLTEKRLRSLVVEYDWDQMMLNPKLVSWDKLSWKNLQQIHNWNKLWSTLFTPLGDLRILTLDLRCSWLNQDFLKAVMQSAISLPNLQTFHLTVEGKDSKLEGLLESYKKAGLLKNFNYVWRQWK